MATCILIRSCDPVCDVTPLPWFRSLRVSDEEVGWFAADLRLKTVLKQANMREIVHLQAGQCGNQIGAKVRYISSSFNAFFARFSCQKRFGETLIFGIFDGCERRRHKSTERLILFLCVDKLWDMDWTEPVRVYCNWIMHNSNSIHAIF